MPETGQRLEKRRDPGIGTGVWLGILVSTTRCESEPDVRFPAGGHEIVDFLFCDLGAGHHIVAVQDEMGPTTSGMDQEPFQ